jgi:hypothetical protein
MGTRRSVSRRAGDVVGNSFFSGVVTLSNCTVASERLLCADRMRYVWSGTIRGLRVESMWHVGQIFPTGCTSIRIAVTLGYE